MYIYLLFETFSNQTLWELHEIVKKIKWKINALSKKSSFQKFYSRIQCHQTCAYKCSPDLPMFNSGQYFYKAHLATLVTSIWFVKKLNGWEIGHWLTASFTFPAVKWKALSDHFQCSCDAINTFQGKMPAFIASSVLGCLSIRVPSVFCWGEELCLFFILINNYFFVNSNFFFDFQVCSCCQTDLIINSILF